MLNSHAPDCDWHTDHYPWECTCGFNKTKDTAAAWQSGYDAGIEAAINALKADAKLCDCAALEERECACGAWADYKTITSARAIELVRALRELG